MLCLCARHIDIEDYPILHSDNVYRTYKLLVGTSTYKYLNVIKKPRSPEAAHEPFPC